VALAEAATPGGLAFQGELLQHIQLHLDRLERAAVEGEKSEDLVTFARRVRAECRRLRVTLEDIRPQVPAGKPTTTLTMGGSPRDVGAAELEEPEEPREATEPQRERPDLPDLPPRGR
jgi:hypothetical protein